jgi:hypothetical protein
MEETVEITIRWPPSFIRPGGESVFVPDSIYQIGAVSQREIINLIETLCKGAGVKLASPSQRND